VRRPPWWGKLAGRRGAAAAGWDDDDTGIRGSEKSDVNEWMDGWMERV
jgi:hypothetical protein